MVDDGEHADEDVEMEDVYDSEGSDMDAHGSEGSDAEDIAYEEQTSASALPTWSAAPLQNGMSGSSTPGLDSFPYGNPFALMQDDNAFLAANEIGCFLSSEQHVDGNGTHAGLAQHQIRPQSLSVPNGDALALSAAVTDEAHAAQAATDANPSMAETLKNWAEAKQFWSNRPDLGFGVGNERQNLYKNFDDFRADTAIAGAPMHNEFYRPNAPAGATAEGEVAVGEIDETERNQATSSTPSRTDNTRGRGGARGAAGQRGRGRRSWKWALKNTEHDSAQQKADKKAERQRVRGTSEGRGRGRPRGRVRKAVDPGREFKKFQTEATTAFMDGNLDVALQAARQAVQANPEVYAAHSLLSEVLLRMNRKEDALAALMSGANTKRDPELWNLVAQRTVELAGEDRTDTHRAQALFAYSHAVKSSPRDEHNNYIARAGKRDMYLELHDYNEARSQSRSMLKLRPDDLENVRTFAELCAETKEPVEFERAKEAYEATFELLEKEEALEDPDDMWSHLNVYLEVVDRLGTLDKSAAFADQLRNAQKAIHTLRRLARRILGRREENFWDDYPDDDREWDAGQERRGLVGEFQQGRASRDKAAYGDGLPIEIRVKLGIFRVKMGMRHHQEGLNHLEHLLRMSDEMVNYYDIFLHVADTLRNCRLWNSAVKFYEAIKATFDVEDDSFFMGSAECYIELGRTPDAEDNYRWLISVHKDHVPARIELAKMYEKIGYNEYALPLVKEVMKLGRRDLIMKADLLPRQHQRPKKALATKPVGKAPQSHQQPTNAITESTVPPQLSPSAQTPTQKDPKLSSKLAAQPQQTTQNLSQQSGEVGMPHAMPNGDMHPPGDPLQLQMPTASLKTSKSPAPRRPDQARRIEERLQRMRVQAQTMELHYRRVQRHWPAVEEGGNDKASKEWMESASAMVDAFRQMDVFYPRKRLERHRTTRFKGYVVRDKGFRKQGNTTEQTVNAIYDRLQDNGDESEGNDGDEGNEGNEDAGDGVQHKTLHPSIPRNFHGIAFDEWHRIFIDLALLYAKFSNQERCYELLQADLLYINVFTFNPVFHNTSLAASLCCALMFNNSELVNDIGRKFVIRGDNRAGGAYQLFAAGNRFCYDNSWFTAGPTQKFMCRMVKTLDYNLLPETVRNRVDHGAHAPSLKARFERLGHGNGELDPGVLMLYGNMLAESNNHAAGALAYFYRALALLPNSFSVHLSIASVYIQGAMRKRTDNRHHGVQQGLSFLQSYYELRTASGKAGHLQEAEYNRAKTWHVLGLAHLAIPAFEKVLALSESVRAEAIAQSEPEVEDFALEAAFALQQLYALVGNDEAARAITEEWLVL
ncbi:hypothetical protein LTR08_005674 [Meristemomyces frigidus]|nr:hypothetical protein LTR08_005674 [Meristemomyces frigidus]